MQTSALEAQEDVPPERSVIRFDHALLEEIARAASAAYPFEGCGALLGETGHARVMLPLPNTELDRPRVRFEVSPKDYLRVEREAEERGLLLLGFWHSHPDHPARPSATDLSCAWVGLLTVIVSVQKGRAQNIGAWEIRAPDLPFERVEIECPHIAGDLVMTLSNEGGA
ncbi:MAG: Mov34/MPN/PAD-1 family protein [Thermoanaerobaculia bacterium]